MEFINRIRKSRKGFTLVEIIVVLVILAILAAFTLVEIIVVLVILAILAAFTIPTMIGFVNDAKKKAAIAEQREVYVAAQAIVTERFAKKGADDAGTALGMTLDAGGAVTKSKATNLNSTSVKAATTTGTNVASQMKNYIGDDLNPQDVGSTTGATWEVTVDTTGRVTEVTYTRDNVTLEPLEPNKDF